MIPHTAQHRATSDTEECGDRPARADLHCHSTASQKARLGIQQSLGLPECATPPQEVYELAKRRGMHFVTITDHDTIEGCLEIADLADVFISEELTAWFPDEPQAVHVLCYGITAEDHEFLQAHAPDLIECAGYLREREIACALAHPFFSVAAPLAGRHRALLAELFGVWEVRNGSRAPELNMPAMVYVETRGGAGVGGSDDHAGVDVGRTWTETPPASTPEEFLAHIRVGRSEARGDQGSAAKWAHSALALGSRALVPTSSGSKSKARDAGSPSEAPLEASALDVLNVAQRVVADGGARGGTLATELGPDHGLALLRAWLGSLALDEVDEPEALLTMMQREGFSHVELYRKARRRHERCLRQAVERVGAASSLDGYSKSGEALFEACLPVIPYVPAISLLGREKAKLVQHQGGARRVAVVVDGSRSMHGVTSTIEQLRERGVPRHEVEVIGTDPRVDSRLPAVAEAAIPFYPGLEVGVPSVPELVETLAEGNLDLIHVTSPGPSGVAALLAARIAGIPVVGSYHTELAAYARVRTRDARLEAAMRLGLGLFYGGCEIVLSPSAAADESLRGLGIEDDRVVRWARGVDTSLFDPARRDVGGFPGEVRVLYAGRLAAEKGTDLLAEAFIRARERDPRLHLLLAGGGPDEEALRARLGRNATFLGWLGREELARAYASADLLLFCSRTDTYGQVILEAQASGLPVVAVAEGGPLSLIADRHTGWLCPPDAESLAGAVAQLAASSFLRERLAQAALTAVRDRTWEAAFEQLATGYELALAYAGRPASASGALAA